MAAATISVLVVDDDAGMREMLTAHLSLAGFAVAQACSGPEALQLMDRVHADAVLMDLGMPHMNGAEAVRRIKTNPASDGTAVIVLTGCSDPWRLAVARAAGADAVMAKPVDLDALVTAIRMSVGLD